MKRILCCFGFSQELNIRDKFVYYMDGISFVLIFIFFLIYIFHYHSWQAILAAFISLIIIIISLVLLKLGMLVMGKLACLLAIIFDIFVFSFYLFSIETNVNLYLLCVPISAFSIFNIERTKEKILALLLSLVGLLAIIVSEFIEIEPVINFTNEDILFFSRSSIILLSIVLTLAFFVYNNEIVKYQIMLTKIASTDALTGISNRRTLFELGQVYFEESKNTDKHFVIMIIDLDHFKRINDNYGHLVGDFVLRETTKIVSSTIPKDAIFARYGGEEFAVVIQNSEALSGFEIAENIRVKISSHSFELESNSCITITVSIGVAYYCSKYEAFDEIMKAADTALYKAKEEGRNRSVIV